MIITHIELIEFYLVNVFCEITTLVYSRTRFWGLYHPFKWFCLGLLSSLKFWGKVRTWSVLNWSWLSWFCRFGSLWLSYWFCRLSSWFSCRWSISLNSWLRIIGFSIIFNSFFTLILRVAWRRSLPCIWFIISICIRIILPWILIPAPSLSLPVHIFVIFFDWEISLFRLVVTMATIAIPWHLVWDWVPTIAPTLVILATFVWQETRNLLLVDLMPIDRISFLKAFYVILFILDNVVVKEPSIIDSISILAFLFINSFPCCCKLRRLLGFHSLFENWLDFWLLEIWLSKGLWR